MDVRNTDSIPVTVEHGGTCRTTFTFPKESVREETMGSYLEYVAEFELEPGTHLEPHYHDTHEFYRILSGEAIVQVNDQQSLLMPGDLLRIPRNAPHSIWPARESGSFRALSFAVSFMPENTEPTVCELPEPRNRIVVE
ncbi:cupin domain-containing protein [Rhodococcus sp. NPDC057014]|uniref:cupin domain-containing protein n=1 Tax=Rhodococcus sp. NPDC057014 TaxID=3346000 RepID=UPI00362F9999